MFIFGLVVSSGSGDVGLAVRSKECDNYSLRSAGRTVYIL
jgi:hypothetical protein